MKVCLRGFRVRQVSLTPTVKKYAGRVWGTVFCKDAYTSTSSMQLGVRCRQGAASQGSCVVVFVHPVQL
jgi:hypothetical protein